jgi:hypothetical protein
MTVRCRLRSQVELVSCLLAVTVVSADAYAQGATDGSEIALSGSIRPRLEFLTGRLSRDEETSDHLASVLTTVRAEADFGQIGLVGEVLDARRLSGPEDGRYAGEVDTLEPVQAYLSWANHGARGDAGDLSIALGRFTMDVGSRRLVARSVFRGPKTSFDGLKLNWRRGSDTEALAFVTSPVIRRPSDAASLFDNEIALNVSSSNTTFSGLHARNRLIEDVSLEGYFFRLDEQDSLEIPTRNRRLTTYGLRVRKQPKIGDLDFELEGTLQSGVARETSRTSDILDLGTQAAMIHAELGFTLETAGSPRLSVHYDYASGDEDPNDESYQRFDPLFGDRSFEFGPTSLWGLIARSNLSSPGLRVDWRPANDADAYLSARSVSLAEAADTLAGSGLQDVFGASGRRIGVQVEGRLRWRPIKAGPRFEIGLAHFSKGDFLQRAPDTPGDTSMTYGYSGATFEF